MGMRVVMYIRGKLAYEIFVIGSVFLFEECSEDLRIFFLSSFIDTMFLLCDSKPCTYDVMYMMRLLLQFFHLSLYVLFLFSLYAYAFYLLYAIFYFFFTLRCHDDFCLKCFRNTGCQSLLAMNSSCKVFQEFVLGYILLHLTSEYQLSDL